MKFTWCTAKPRAVAVNAGARSTFALFANSSLTIATCPSLTADNSGVAAAQNGHIEVAKEAPLLCARSTFALFASNTFATSTRPS